MGSQLPRKKGHSHTQFLAHDYCGQTAAWIKMPLGTEVKLGPGDVVLDGVAPPPKRAQLFSLRFMSIVAKRLDGRIRHLVRKQTSALATLCWTGTQFPHLSYGAQKPPSFRPMFIVATVAHFSYC